MVSEKNNKAQKKHTWIDRRNFDDPTYQSPERRSGAERRKIPDRRSGFDRRGTISVQDRRSRKDRRASVSLIIFLRDSSGKRLC